MTAVRDLAMEQGSSFRFTFYIYDDLVDAGGNVVLGTDGLPQQGLPRDFTGWTGRMQVRKSHLTPVLVDITSANITLGPLGKVVIYAGADKTMGLLDVTGPDPTKAISKGVYDLELVRTADLTDVDRLLMGKVTVSPNVTR